MESTTKSKEIIFPSRYQTTPSLHSNIIFITRVDNKSFDNEDHNILKKVSEINNLDIDFYEEDDKVAYYIKEGKTNMNESFAQNYEEATNMFWDELHEGGAFYDLLVEYNDDDFEKASIIVSEMENKYGELPYPEVIHEMEKEYLEWASYTKQWIESYVEDILDESFTLELDMDELDIPTLHKILKKDWRFNQDDIQLSNDNPNDPTIVIEYDVGKDGKLPLSIYKDPADKDMPANIVLYLDNLDAYHIGEGDVDSIYDARKYLFAKWLKSKGLEVDKNKGTLINKHWPQELDLIWKEKLKNEDDMNKAHEISDKYMKAKLPIPFDDLEISYFLADENDKNNYYKEMTDMFIEKEGLKENLNNTQKYFDEVKVWVQDDFEYGKPMDPDDFNEFKHLLTDNHPELANEEELMNKLWDYYWDCLENCTFEDSEKFDFNEEVEEEKEKCVLCGQEIIGYGNNAEPLAKGRCCDKCNQDVILARLNNFKDDEEIIDEDLDLDEKLIQSDSEQAFKKNVQMEIEAGKPRNQALAIAYSVRDKNRKKVKEDLDFDDEFEAEEIQVNKEDEKTELLARINQLENKVNLLASILADRNIETPTCTDISIDQNQANKMNIQFWNNQEHTNVSIQQETQNCGNVPNKNINIENKNVIDEYVDDHIIRDDNF